MNSRSIITGIIYTQFDDVHGTIPYAWIPENIDEKLKILAGVKSISLLTAEDGHSPKSLIILPHTKVHEDRRPRPSPECYRNFQTAGDRRSLSTSGTGCT